MILILWKRLHDQLLILLQVLLSSGMAYRNCVLSLFSDFFHADRRARFPPNCRPISRYFFKLFAFRSQDFVGFSEKNEDLCSVKHCLHCTAKALRLMIPLL